MQYASAAASDRTKMRNLGFAYLTGDGAPFDPLKGFDQILGAAVAGDGVALAAMATLTAAGGLTEQNWPLAFDYLRRAAEAGSSEAQGQLIALSGSSSQGLEGEVSRSWGDLADRVDVAAWVAPPPRAALCEAPRVRKIEGFVSGAVCDWIRRRVEGRMRPALMYNPATKIAQRDPHRTCSDYEFDILNTDLVVLLVRARIAAATGLPTVAMEPPRIFHYATGQEIRPHYDRCGNAAEGYGASGGYLGDRIVTFLLYLNDGFEGGELAFPKADFRCVGAKGDGVYFAHIDAAGQPDPLSLHAGLKIRLGEKWVLSQWIHDRPFGVVAAP